MHGTGDRGDEGARIGMRRVLKDLAVAAALGDAAEVHHRDAITHVLYHAEVVADHDSGEPESLLQFEQQVDDLCADRHV